MNRRQFVKGCAACGAMASFGFPAVVRARPKGYRRVVLLGMDGIDFGLVHKYAAAGELPAFKALLEGGKAAPLATTTPPQSPVSWTSIATGVGPGQHGMFDFLERDPESYTPRLAITRQQSGGALFGAPEYVNPVQARPFWEDVADADIPATVLKWPVTFPAPDKSRAKLLSGMGVPDVQGNIGRYAFYTDAPDDGGPAGHKVVRLVFSGAAAQTEVRGPLVAGLTGTKPATVDMTIRRTADGVRLVAGEHDLTLAPGAFSPWLTFSFNMGFGRTVSAMGRFCLVQAAPHVRLYLTPLNLTPADPAFPISSPAGYAGELAENIGNFATLGIPADTKALTEGRLTNETFLTLCYDLLTEQEKLFDYGFANAPEGLMAGVLFTTDRIQHMFWAALDPKHPLYSKQYAKRYGGVLLELYKRMDARLARLMQDVDDRTLLLAFSDHGFSTYRHSVHVNRLLAAKGHLTLTGAADPADPDAGALFANVDWAQTAAYAVGLNSVYVNLQGREGEGVVPPSRRDELVRRIAADLESFRHQETGEQAVAKAFDGRKLYGNAPGAPDIVLGFRPGYRSSWQTAVGGCPEMMVSANRKKWSGDHCIAPGFVPGIVCSNVPLAAKAPSVRDIAPTVLAALGLPVPKRYTGAPLAQAASGRPASG
ncbi:alkaline phosphatase family protein [Desulfobaculum sp.]